MVRTFILSAAMLISLAVAGQSKMELTAKEIAAQMTPGWNLGNTMEAGNNANNFTNRGGLGAETSWQQTKTTQAVIDFVKKQGFRSVRIPCAWVMGHLSNATNYTIDQQWMARVKEIVDYCIKDGLYVIINQHWDGGWLENNISNSSSLSKNTTILKTIWTQIAEAFKDYDEHLLFAGLNEPNADDQLATNNLLTYEQVFIDAVRATGGNNAKRVLVVQGPGTDIDKTSNYYKIDKLTDTATDRLMAEVHYYAPWNFWGMEKDESWGNMFFYWGKQNYVSGSKHNATWGEEDFMEDQLNKMKKQFVDKGIPVVIGEYGVNWRTITGSGESQTKHNASIRYFYKTFNEKCVAKGMVPMVWDTNYTGRPSMTIVDRKNLSVYNTFMMEGISEGITSAINEITIDSPFTNGVSSTDKAFDLLGRPVNATLPGIRIQNGRKYFQK